MGRFGAFLLGVFVGAILLHTAMNYHVVRTEQGTHLVPKSTANLSGLYADVRNYGIDDWRRNPALARAMIVAAKARESDQRVGDSGFRQAAGAVLGTVLKPRN